MYDRRPYPEWIPLERFSQFWFGITVVCCPTIGVDGIEAREGSTFEVESEAVRGHFRQALLGCDIRTIFGDIHEISVSSACLLNGLNLIGSMVDPVLTMLGNPQVSWSYRDPARRKDLVGVVSTCGLVLEAPNVRGPISVAKMWGAPDDHEKRERAAVIGMDLRLEVDPRLKVANDVIV